MAASESKKQQRWFALESNPTLINDYIQKLGFDSSSYQFLDVFSTEDWALEMIPQPVAAVIMLYPLTPTQTKHEDNPENILQPHSNNNVWFIKQRIGNACGTISLLHSLLNAPEAQLSLIQTDSWLHAFRDDTPVSLDPISKAERLEADSKIASLHDEATSSEANQTNRGDIEDDVETHFVAFVHVDGHLYELDGRKAGPVQHGETSQPSLLSDACRVVTQFMERDPGEVRFTILALAPRTAD
jgi:ubiquitin carboxyl-terminal hydrolase L3